MPAARPSSESLSRNLVLVIGKPFPNSSPFPSPCEGRPCCRGLPLPGPAEPRSAGPGRCSIIVGALAMLAEVEAFALDVGADPKAGEQFGDSDRDRGADRRP